MYRGQVRGGELQGADRELADVMREVNELRRSRLLPEYEPTTTNFRVLPRQPSRRRLRSLCRR
jgi:hypothetical protein